MLLVSIPESDIEIGGEGVRRTLEILAKAIGGVEATCVMRGKASLGSHRKLKPPFISAAKSLDIAPEQANRLLDQIADVHFGALPLRQMAF